MEWLTLLRLIGQTFALYLLRPDLLMIAGVVLMMVYSQYRRTAMVELHMFGVVKNHPGVQMGRAVLYGALGGVMATAIFILLGISLNEVGIWPLWILALLLMLIHPRFLCFSYGAGILALSHLIFGLPDLDIPALMALVAILHLVEAVLIHLVGAAGATPIYVRHGQGRIVGGFMLQKYWPIPFVALLSAVVPAGVIDPTQAVSMPDWWPLIHRATETPAGMEYAFALFPVVAALGYSDVALTCSPRVKSRRTAGRLLLYSVGLLLLAFLAQYSKAFALAAALFSPLAHEWVIRRERALEQTGKPRFAGPETMILDVHPGSPAQAAGLAPGDVITAVNGYPVRTRLDLADAIDPWAFDAELTVQGPDGGMRRVRLPGKVPPLGVILIPTEREGVVMDLREEPHWKRLWRGVSKRWRKGA